MGIGQQEIGKRAVSLISHANATTNGIFLSASAITSGLSQVIRGLQRETISISGK